MRVAKCPTYLLNIIKYLVLFFFWVIFLFIVDKFLLVARKDSKKETPSTSTCPLDLASNGPDL